MMDNIPVRVLVIKQTVDCVNQEDILELELIFVFVKPDFFVFILF